MSRRKTHEQFESEIIEKFGNQYEFITKYTRVMDSITIKHKECGYEWSPLANNLLRGQSKCPNCSGKRKISTEEMQKRLDVHTNGEIEIVGEFNGISSDNMTTLKHKPCGYEFEVCGGHFNWAKPIGCRKCSDKLIHTTERVRKLFEERLNGDYLLLSESENNRTLIDVQHKECGQVYKTTSADLLYNNDVCPKCFDTDGRQSLGERKIEKFLIDNNIKFESEFSFEDCRHINKLLFDFVVFDDNENIRFLIEFDGKQHYEPVEYFGGEDGFKLTQKRDGIKNDYCKNNSIPLLRIPYHREDEIDTILSEQLNIVFKEVS